MFVTFVCVVVGFWMANPWSTWSEAVANVYRFVGETRVFRRRHESTCRGRSDTRGNSCWILGCQTSSSVKVLLTCSSLMPKMMFLSRSAVRYVCSASQLMMMNLKARTFKLKDNNEGGRKSKRARIVKAAPYRAMRF